MENQCVHIKKKTLSLEIHFFINNSNILVTSKGALLRYVSTQVIVTPTCDALYKNEQDL